MTRDPFGDYYGSKADRHASPGWQFLVAAFAVSLGLYLLGAVLRVVEGLA